jgi:hypothetical protein
MSQRTGDENLGAILAIVMASQNQLSAQSAKNAIRAAVPEKPAQTRTIKYLRAHPDALTDGGPGPAAVYRLVAALSARGATGFELTRCPACSKTRELPYRVDDHYVCRTCYSKRINVASCAICTRTGSIALRGPNGPICQACYKQDASRHEICSACDTPSVIVRRHPAPMCQLCYVAPKKRCDACGEMRALHSTKGGVNVCEWCYRARANNIRNLRKRLPRRPLRRRTCAKCSQLRLCVDFTTDRPLCVLCADPLTRECVSCKNSVKAHAVWAVGPICKACSEGRSGECESCREIKARVIDINGRRFCVRCLGQGGVSNCLCCGRAGRPFDNGHCAQCCADIEFDRIGLTRGSALYPLRKVLSSQSTATALLKWFKGGRPGAAIIADFARRNAVPTHADLDALDPRQSNMIRSALVAANLLPDRIDAVSRVERWFNNFIEQADPDHREILVSFGRWHMLRRLRASCERRSDRLGSASNARARIRAALHFLRWLDSKGRTMAECRQEDIDDWLATSNTTGYDVRTFVRWASRKRLSRQLIVPEPETKSPTAPTEEIPRWATVQKLLTDATIPATDRVAGLFLLLYAQPVSRIRRLNELDVKDDEAEILVRFGPDWTPLCPILDDLVRSLVRDHRTIPRARTGEGITLLFPSPTRYGVPIVATAMARRLTGLGINIVADRLSIERELLRTIGIPRVVADMIGIHIETAVAKATQLNVSASKYAVKNVRRSPC